MIEHKVIKNLSEVVYNEMDFVGENIRPFDAKSNLVHRSNDFILNCHECGKTFAPLTVIFAPTNKQEYYLGTYCRLAQYRIIKGEVCEHIKKHIGEKGYSYTWLYDKKDDMQGKINDELRES